MEGQMSFEDYLPDETEKTKSGNLQVVMAEFKEVNKCNWSELFAGFDRLYGITFSSGIQFFEKVMEQFEYAEMIFGCEGVMDSDYAAIMSMQTKSVELIAKSSSAKRMAERIDSGTLALFVSRVTRSHEKIFILEANDGRKRVITGSANMSASAFCGLQREDIVCFDDTKAFERYFERFLTFRDQCADSVSDRDILNLISDGDYIRDNFKEVPINKTIEKKSMVILEQSGEDGDEGEIVADIKGLEHELKPLLPKLKKDDGKVLLQGTTFRAAARNHKESIATKKEKAKYLPKLHLDYEAKKISFNGKEMEINPSPECIVSDINCFKNYMSSVSCFHGDWKSSQESYFAFMNWYFSSPFMPYLRYVASKNGYDVNSFPVFGMIYGDSNGGKSTFLKLLSKMMCGKTIPANKSSDFTYTRIEDLKRSCEGLPINIDDLAKNQYDVQYEKIIKDDGWGLQEGFVNYPAIVISTNKIEATKPDISKRMVLCNISTRIDKEIGLRNSKKVNDSMNNLTSSFFGEYVRRMLPKIDSMVEQMKSGNDEYFPDIFAESSEVLKDIFFEYSEEVPEYVALLTYSDYFSEKSVGKNAINKIKTAWENDWKMFETSKKNNKLIYRYADSSRTYKLAYIQQELPPVLNATIVGSSLVMDLDKAKEIFQIDFKKKKFSIM